MLSKTIRDAATSGKYNEFDLETWAHEAWKKEQRMRDLDVENAELREELAAVLYVAANRGETLGYEDEDYRERMRALDA